MGINSLGIGLSGLRTNLVNIETTGHNITNANTEGYTRQRVDQETRLPNDQGAYIIGQGTLIGTVNRVADNFLESRLRKETSVYSGLQENASILNEVEFSLNELTDQDLSSKINAFFNAIHDFSNNVSDNSTRIALLEQGASLAAEFNRLDQALNDVQKDINGKVENGVSNINLYLDKIASINQEIIRTEAGGFSTAVANDLRDKRDVYLKQLSEIIDIDIREESNGAILVSSAGQRLVSQNESFPLEAVRFEENGVEKILVRYTNTSAFEISGGRLGAMTATRDSALNGIRDQLDTLAGQFIFEMNKLQATGRGTEGLTSVESTYSVMDANVPLDVAKFGFDTNDDIFKVKNGSFDVIVENLSDGSQRVVTIDVDLNGTDNETTLNDLLRQLNVVPNLKAELTSQRKVQISSTSANIQFYFANDTSNFLAAMGVNSFFTGVSAGDMAVNQNLRNKVNLVSGALSSREGDNSNAVRFSNLRDLKSFGDSNLTLDESYQAIVGKVAIETNRAKELVKTHELILTNLSNLKEEISGVSIDEEAANLLRFQRSYQASARFVSVVSDLLDTLINRLGV